MADKGINWVKLNMTGIISKLEKQKLTDGSVIYWKKGSEI